MPPPRSGGGGASGPSPISTTRPSALDTSLWGHHHHVPVDEGDLRCLQSIHQEVGHIIARPGLADTFHRDDRYGHNNSIIRRAKAVACGCSAIRVDPTWTDMPREASSDLSSRSPVSMNRSSTSPS